jgi:hypothetical protein
MSPLPKAANSHKTDGARPETSFGQRYATNSECAGSVDLSEFQTLIPVSGRIQVSNSLTALIKKFSYSISFNGLAGSQLQSTMATELPLNSIATGVLDVREYPVCPTRQPTKGIQISSDEARGLDHQQNRI